VLRLLRLPSPYSRRWFGSKCHSFGAWLVRARHAAFRAIAYTIVAAFLFGLSRSAAILSLIESSNEKVVAATPAE